MTSSIVYALLTMTQPYPSSLPVLPTWGPYFEKPALCQSAIDDINQFNPQLAKQSRCVKLQIILKQR